jgi:hypothetical protein
METAWFLEPLPASMTGLVYDASESPWIWPVPALLILDEGGCLDIPQGTNLIARPAFLAPDGSGMLRRRGSKCAFNTHADEIAIRQGLAGGHA